MAEKGMGQFGWFSFGGAVIMGILYVFDKSGRANSIASRTMTLFTGMLAGIGAVLLYYGRDPTRARAPAVEEEESPLERVMP